MPYRVLIVDDQKGVSRLLRSALETIEQGLIISEAPSGEEAILEARRTRMDLLVADYRLPGINGVELMKKFRLINPGGKVIIISGVADPRMFRQVTEAAPDAFFAKPVPMSDFLSAVETCLDLVPTIVSPLKPIEAVLPELQEPRGLPDLLVSLRKDLDAQAVLLIDQMGMVAAEAGEIPGLVNNANLISSLLGLLGVAQNMAGLMDQSEGQLHIFKGRENDSIYLPVGQAYALLVVGKGLADARLLSGRLELISAAQIGILDELTRIQGIPPQNGNLGQIAGISGNSKSILENFAGSEKKSHQVSAIEEPYTRPEDLSGDFLNILDQIGAKKVDADRFWDDVVEKGTTFSEPDKLSYEQASRLGLTPDSAQDE